MYGKIHFCKKIMFQKTQRNLLVFLVFCFEKLLMFVYDTNKKIRATFATACRIVFSPNVVK